MVLPWGSEHLKVSKVLAKALGAIVKSKIVAMSLIKKTLLSGNAIGGTIRDEGFFDVAG